MPWPKSTRVKVGHRWWTITVPASPLELDEQGAEGLCLSGRSLILLHPEREHLGCCLHELAHALGEHIRHDVGDKKTDDILDRYAQAAAAFLADNPDFVRMILDYLDEIRHD